ncbi:MAG: P-II family nitrogen regulator [Nitriliruptoraceae bacterium]
MTMEGLTPMTRVEVIVGGDQVALIRDLFRGSGARGWTAVPGVSGFGHSGEHAGRLLFNDRDGLHWLFTVVPPDRAEALVAAVRRVLEDHPGVVLVSETYVSRPEHFR